MKRGKIITFGLFCVLILVVAASGCTNSSTSNDGYEKGTREQIR